MTSRSDDDRTSDSAIGRRGLMKCMAWAGTGVLWTISGGLAQSVLIGDAQAATRPAGALSFAQISDTHVGFDKAAHPDAIGTTRAAIARIKALPARPAFVIHTGDITHLSKDAEFDTADQLLGEMGLPIFRVPGEHDTLDDANGKVFLSRYGKGTRGTGWYSFDHAGVHFIALVNVVNLRPSGEGFLGAEQIAWIGDDVAHLSASTPIVVMAHMPLFDVYEPWGWGTSDAAPALAHLRRFGSVTVLNGHIHQVIEKVEGNITFHTARSTAFPQAAPGAPGASPGPLKVPADQLRGVLGVREIKIVRGRAPLAIVDSTLA
ncbi:MAG TPA: metallophosphoesterase [Caulobacteraceae bacterium]